MRRGLRYNRRQAWRHALRKRRIARQVYKSWHWDEDEWDYYDHLHQFSKNKIHCSCPMCSAKTRNKGKRSRLAHGYARHINYKPSDLKKIQRLEMSKEDYENFDFSENL